MQKCSNFILEQKSLLLNIFKEVKNKDDNKDILERRFTRVSNVGRLKQKPESYGSSQGANPSLLSIG